MRSAGPASVAAQRRESLDSGVAGNLNLLHFGMAIIGLPYRHQGQLTLDEIVGGSPYGATTIAGGQGRRQPGKIELDGAHHQGEWIAKATNKRFG